jgi:hypothetical protein
MINRNLFGFDQTTFRHGMDERLALPERDETEREVANELRKRNRSEGSKTRLQASTLGVTDSGKESAMVKARAEVIWVAMLKHELWNMPGHGVVFYLTAPMGDQAHSLLPQAKLTSTVEAGSHFEAMRAYCKVMDFGEYQSKPDREDQPYPDGWRELPRTRGQHVQPTKTAQVKP